MKALICYAQTLIQCGHIQDITVLFDKYMYVKANFLPEMRKDRFSKLLFFLHLESSDIVAAECGCPVGKGVCASCRRIGAKCFALEEFSCFGNLHEFLTCIDQLQQWKVCHWMPLKY